MPPEFQFVERLRSIAYEGESLLALQEDGAVHVLLAVATVPAGTPMPPSDHERHGVLQTPPAHVWFDEHAIAVPHCPLVLQVSTCVSLVHCVAPDVQIPPPLLELPPELPLAPDPLAS